MSLNLIDTVAVNLIPDQNVKVVRDNLYQFTRFESLFV